MALIRHNDTENKRMRVLRRIENHALELEHGVAPEQNGLKTPVLKGISESEFEAFADAIVIASQPEAPDTVDVGPFTKAVSNMDYDEASALSRL